MESPIGIDCVIPSTLGVGEAFTVKLRLRGEPRPVPSAGGHCNRKPGLRGQFNLNVQRQIQFHDDVLPEWQGELEIIAAEELDGPQRIVFDGEHQGIFPGDKRPIRQQEGFSWRTPGCHFLRLRDPVSGVEAWSNPCWVEAEAPQQRLVWGDPHWQTFFSDGIRCPEDLYNFARNEAFLDFGAVSDHMEAVTDRQWDYFTAVTNDCNEPGSFVTLVGQEWTHHDVRYGAPGHRNIYVRGDRCPVLRSNDEDCNTLDKLWAKLDAFGEPAVVIPHHSASKAMGVPWEQGWSPRYEKAVEMVSVWGSSEKPASEGNTRPIHNGGGEMAGRHVRDALGLGYRLGFVGGGDVHDGRAGLAMHAVSYPKRDFVQWGQGWTAAWVPQLTREAVFDAIATHQTYATTTSRIYLSATASADGMQLRAASEDGLRRIVQVSSSGETEIPLADDDPRVVEQCLAWTPPEAGDYHYLRVETASGELAWSSPSYPPQSDA